MTKKFAVIILCALFSMCFFVSCGSDDEEDIVSNTDQNGNENGENADENGSGNNQNGENTNENADNSGQNDNDINENNNDVNENNNDVDENTVDNDPNGNGDNENNGVNDNENGDDSDNGDSQQPDADVDTGDTGSNQGDDGNLSNSDANQTAQPGSVGAPCSSENDCKGSFGSGDSEQTPSCLDTGDGFPNGYCTYISDAEAKACNNLNEIHYGYNAYEDGYCYHRCSKPSDCRKGYRCSNKVHACMPDCKAPGYECYMNGVCDETDGVCLKSGY